MTTTWDRAVRALRPLFEGEETGPRLPSPTPEGGTAYYCGGPPRRCSHTTCAAVTAIAVADLLHDPALPAPAPAPADERNLAARLLELAAGWEHTADELAAALPDPMIVSFDSDQARSDGMADTYRDLAGQLRALAGRGAWEIGDVIACPRQPPVGATVEASDAFGSFRVTRDEFGWRQDSQGRPVGWRAALTAWGPVSGDPGPRFVVVKLPPRGAE